jgi:hypothetical protein
VHLIGALNRFFMFPGICYHGAFLNVQPAMTR